MVKDKPPASGRVIPVIARQGRPFLLTTFMLGAWLGSAATAVADEPADWPTPAHLIDNVCLDPVNKDCSGKPVRHQVAIQWDAAHTQTRMIVPGAKVRLGPFRISKRVERLSGANPASSSFIVSVWARSPALYDANGQYAGAQQGLVQIGTANRTLGGGDNEEEVLYVTATLPGIFTAVQIRASVGPLGAASRFPADCGELPASAAAPEALDQPCLQVAVNPLAVLVPKVVPLAIVYEPPGNCSWANLTNSHAAGSAITVEQSTSTSSRTITDAQVVVQVDHSDFTEEKTKSSSRRSQVTVSRSQSVGTELGLPLESPGNPECNNPDVTVPDRPSAGPGKGDLFVLLYEPALIYWNTENMSNFVFLDQAVPGHPRQYLVATATQIATGQGLPAGVSFTPAEAKAILDLDPFTNPAWSPTTLPARMIFLNEVWAISQGLAVEQNQSQRKVTIGEIKEAVRNADVSPRDNVDFATKLSLLALNFGASAAAKAGIGAALGWLATQWPDPSAAGFDDLDATVKGVSVPKLFDIQNQTTVTTTYTRSVAIEASEETAITQSFHVKDRNQGLRVALFYDALFGSFAFVPWPEGMGVARDREVRRLPSLEWSLTATPEGQVVERMSPQLRAQVAEAGGTRALAASTRAYDVADPLAKGLPAGFRLDLTSATLRGRIEARTQAAQALYVLSNAQGRAVAQLWVTIRRPPR